MSQLIDTKEAAEVLGVAPSTLKVSRVYGVLLGKQAPQYRKIGRAVRYDRSVLEKWLEDVTEVRHRSNTRSVGGL